MKIRYVRAFWTVWCAAFFAFDAFSGAVYLHAHRYGVALYEFAFAALMIYLYLWLRRKWARQDELDRQDEEFFTKYRSFPRR